MANVRVEHFDLASTDIKVPVMIIELKDRCILSVPTQIGCPVRCEFCISKYNIFERNITHAELACICFFGLSFSNGKPAMISFTGEGEPLLNIENVNATIKEFEQYKQVESFRICTSGTRIEKLQELHHSSKPIDLQISLHSPFDMVRSSLIRTSRPIGKIIMTVLALASNFREISVNYVLMKDVNDRDEDLAELTKIIPKDWLIKLNPLLEELEYTSSPRGNLFYDELVSLGHNVKKFFKIGSTIKNEFYDQLTYEMNEVCAVSL